ncbi:unnamed protein product [Rotaria socialis]|uniref:Uncharacterized protein n=1 Tax=Rotaria socialis TaxID=392032 RepID=A0A821D3G3_9BILA|nr:unnamed protein product [Rotaria socialis]CAF4615444.1 unnamed protein product [Rotaria socialis]
MTITLTEDRCSCSCWIGLDWIGFGCYPIQKPDFSIPLCIGDNGACVALSKNIYPADCNHIYSHTFAICTSGTSKIFNQYTIFNILSIMELE